MDFTVDRVGRFASKGTVGPYMARPPQKAGQADFSVPAIAVCPKVDILVLEGSPQPFNEDAVVAALSAGPADLDPFCLQPGHKVSGRELTALIGVENLRATAASKGHHQRFHAELRVKTVREPPAEHMPGMEIHDRH
jgi:hypothetical protein